MKNTICTLLAVVLIAAPATLFSQVAGSLDPAFNPNVDGDYVLATAVQPDGKILVGGRFFYVGDQPRNNIARLNPDGSVESTATFNPGAGATGTIRNDEVRCVAVQADGKILVGGDFTTVDGQPRNNIARLNPDGTVESTTSFNPGTGTDGDVYSMAVQTDGKILLGGSFRTVNGQPRNGIARLNVDGTVESTATFNPGIGTSGVYSVAVQVDGKVLLGGDFTVVDNHTRNYIARLNPDGTVEDTTTFNSGTDASDGGGGTVYCVAVQADGKILLGGRFASVNGQTRNRIARLNPDGSVESTGTFDPGLGISGDISPSVSSVAVQADGKILLGGTFTRVNGQTRNRIARLNANGTVESTSTFNSGSGVEAPVYGSANVAMQADGKILLGGDFASVNGQPRNRIARLNNGTATQSLTVLGSERVRWLRSGSAPEIEQVTFDLSTDGGVNWSLLGAGTRITGGWVCTGLSIPVTGTIRARGRTGGGLVEQTAAFGPPLLTLSAPAAGQKVSGSAVVFSGLVPDSARVARVELALNGGAQQLVALDSQAGAWALSTLPENGVNTVVVSALNTNGDVVAQITRAFTFLHLRPQFSGSYNGLLEATVDSSAPIDHEGLLAITVVSTGRFTGKVMLSGQTFPISGLLLNDGSTRFGKTLSATVELIKKTKPVSVSLGHLALTLDSTPGAERIAGTLTQGAATVATLTQADRALYTAKKNPIAPLMNVPVTLSDPLGNKGKYTALFRAGDSPNNGVATDGFPQGHGWAKVTIATTGRVTIVGKLADGSPLRYGNALSKTNELPVFVPLYARKGFVAGRVAFDPSQPQTDASDAGMKWFKPANAKDRLYPDGWPGGITTDFAASKLVLPTKASVANPAPLYLLGTHSILGLVGAPTPADITLTLADGGTPGFSNEATADAKSKVIIGAASAGATAAPKLKTTLAAGTGALTGSFTHPGNNKAAAFSGVVFQKTHTAGGFFLYFPPKPPDLPAPSGHSRSVSIARNP